MGDLISILNSGESLEKAAVLTKLALQHNPTFYSNYKKITVLYCENLPKKEKGYEVHGTLGGIMTNLGRKNYLKYQKKDDVWDDRDYTLDKLCYLGRISERTREKLYSNKEHFDKVVFHLPWPIILDNFKEILVRELLDSNLVNLEFLDFRKQAESIFMKTPWYYSWRNRPFLLNPDGSISSHILWKWHDDPELNLIKKYKKQLEALKRSIVLSPNVFMFLLGTYFSYCQDDNDITIGFRMFGETRRASYDHGIEFIQKQKPERCVEEPRNQLFNDLLDQVDKDYWGTPADRKTTLAIYKYLNRII